MKPREYNEGPEALEDFKKLAATILQSDPQKQKKQPKKAAPIRKQKKSDQN